MNCLAQIIKYILYIVNLVFLVCGVLLIVFGALTLTSLGNFRNFSEATSINTLPICILTLGCVVFLVAFLGCCGAIKDNKCLVNTYSFCMLILLLLQIALIIYTWVARQQFLNFVGELVDKAWNIHDEQPSYMDALQLSFDCCGKSSALDYQQAHEQIPNSCCGKLSVGCPAEDAAQKFGCRRQFVEFWETNTNIIKYVGLAVALVELIAMIFGYYLANNIREGLIV